MKNKILVFIVLIIVIICGGYFLYKQTSKTSEVIDNRNIIGDSNLEESNNISNDDVRKSKPDGTAGSNIPLKDNTEEAEYQIKVAVQNLLEETYGEKVFDARIYVTKIYTTEEEQKTEVLKDLNLGLNDVAFEVNYELKLVDGVDPIEFTAASGVYDEESGWVTEKYNVGILRPKKNGEGYEITDFGTGF